MRMLFSAAALAGIMAFSSISVSANDLGCLEDQLDDGQRAAIGSLFAEQTDDPTDERKMASGSAAASGDFAVAIGGCANRFNWSGPQRELAEQYLIRLGALSQVSVTQSDDWSSAMEAYAPFGARLLSVETDEEGEESVTEHSRAMIAAGAHANGVSAGSDDESDSSPIVAYLQNYVLLEEARSAFNAAS